jgi:MFS family permease
LIPFAFSALAFGGVLVPKVNLVLSLVCRKHLQEKRFQGNMSTKLSFDIDDRCRTPQIQSEVATFKLWMSLISGSLAAVVAPKLGALSDRFGRTRLLAFPTVSGQIISEIITIFAARYPDTISFHWLLLGSVFDGLGGSFIASMALSHSYAADCTTGKRRNVVFGLFHGFMSTGIAVGPVLAGWIIKSGDMITMFYIACGLHIIFFLLLTFVIPESVHKSRQVVAEERHRQLSAVATTGWARSMSNMNILEPLQILRAPNAHPILRRNLMFLAATDMIVFGVGMGANVVILLYSNYRFGWDQWEQSKFTSIVNSCRVTYLLVLLPIFTHFYYRRKRSQQHRPATPPRPKALEGTDPFELMVIRVAILADCLGFLSYATSTTGTQFILSGVIASIGGIGSPTMQAALTKHVPKDSVGQLLGAMGLLHALGRVVGPSVFMGIYALTVGVFPQAYFIILAIMFAFGFLMSLFIRPGGW